MRGAAPGPSGRPTGAGGVLPGRGSSGAPVSTRAPTSSGRAAARAHGDPAPERVAHDHGTGPGPGAPPTSSSRAPRPPRTRPIPTALAGAGWRRNPGGRGPGWARGPRAPSGPTRGRSRRGYGAIRGAPATTGGPFSPRLAVQRPTGERPQHPGEATPGNRGPTHPPRHHSPPVPSPRCPAHVPRRSARRSCCTGSPRPSSAPCWRRTPPCACSPRPGRARRRSWRGGWPGGILDGSARAEHTLVVTFTRKASPELRSRLGRLGVPARLRPGRSTPSPSPSSAATGPTGRAPPGGGGRSPPPGPGRPGTPILRSPGTAAAVLGELHWAQVRHARPRRLRRRRPGGGRDTLLGVAPEDWPRSTTRYVEEKKSHGVLDLDDLVHARRVAARGGRGRGGGPAVAHPARVRRRVPGREPGPVAPAHGVARGGHRPLRGR